MSAVLIDQLTVEAQRALLERAERHGRSAEAELRVVIEDALVPSDRVRLGSELAAIGRRFGADLKIERDQTPVEPVSFD